MSRAKSALTSTVPSSDLLQRLRGHEFHVMMMILLVLVLVLVRQNPPLPRLAVALALALAVSRRMPVVTEHPVVY